MSSVELVEIYGAQSSGTLMTPEEFDTAEDWDELFVYELINGVLIVNPPPSAAERGPNELLGFLLRLYQDQHPQGRSLDYTLPENTIPSSQNRRRADRVIWAGLGRMPDVQHDPPTIVVEFVSKGLRNRQRDYHAKRTEYMELSVAEYWLIDRFRRTMTIVIMTENKQYQERTLSESDVISTGQLPGFEVPLAKLMAEADKFQ